MFYTNSDILGIKKVRRSFTCPRDEIQNPNTALPPCFHSLKTPSRLIISLIIGMALHLQLTYALRLILRNIGSEHMDLLILYVNPFTLRLQIRSSRMNFTASIGILSSSFIPSLSSIPCQMQSRGRRLLNAITAFVYPRNDVPMRLTPSIKPGGCPHVIFCLPRREA